MSTEPADYFERKIIRTEPHQPTGTLVTYECGHQAIWAIRPFGTTACCAECVTNFVKASYSEDRPQ